MANRCQLASQRAGDSSGLNIQSGSLSWPVGEVGYWLRALLGQSTRAPKPGLPMCFSQSDSWFKEGVAQSKNSTFPGRCCKAYYDLSTEAQNIPSTTFSRKSKSLRLVQIQGAGNETLSCMWEWQDHVAEAHRALVLPPSQFSSVQFSCSVVSYSVTPWTAGRQASLSITNSRSLLKLTSIKSVIPSKHLTLCCPLLLPPSIFPSIRVFSSESVFRMRWPKYWKSKIIRFLKNWFTF